MPSKKSTLSRILTFVLLPILCIILSLKVFAADTTAPYTTAAKDPAEPDGNNGWYKKPVTITLESTDTESGVKEINYKIDLASWKKFDLTDTLNLAPNPSFEISDYSPPLDVKDWDVGTTDSFATYSKDTSEYMPGFESTSVKIESTGGSWHSVNNIDSPAYSSSYISMSAYAWIKSSSATTGNAYFKIYAISEDVNGVKTISPVAESPSISGQNDWTKVSLNFVVNAQDVIGVYMDVGLNGVGTMWVDAVNIAASILPKVTFTVATDSAAHVVQYYAVDRAGNEEGVKNVTFKIDQTPPGNWRDAGAVRALSGNDHELYLWTHVDDVTAGFSPETDKFQYTTKHNPGFGTFEDLTGCASTWQPDDWATTATIPPLPGDHTAYLVTPKVDFCDSEWKICKYVRFYAEDMAGNNASKDICINGPWIKVRGKGIVGTSNIIDMVSEAVDYNTDGLIETGGDSSNFFDSSAHLHFRESPAPPDYNYDNLSALSTGSKITISTSGDLVSSSGVYKVDGNYEITSHKIPGNYDEASFNQIVFINGDLKISSDIKVASGSTALFIVKGKVEIQKNVTDMEIGLIADGRIYTAYNITEGEHSSTLILKGVFICNKFVFQRTLQGTQNEYYPSEDFTYEPKYVVKLGEYLGKNAVKWVYSD